MNFNAAFWDERFDQQELIYGEQPNAFIERSAPHIRTMSRVLAAGDGEGRNAVFLAEQGHDVTIVDWSEKALQKARRLAHDRSVTVHSECANLAEWKSKDCAFDAAIMVFVHTPPDIREEVHSNIWRALRPSGLLIAQFYTPAQLAMQSGGPKNPAMLYDAALLRSDFPNAQFERLIEVTETIDEGPYHQGPAALLEVIARKC